MKVARALIALGLFAVSAAAAASPPNLLTSVSLDPQTFAMLLSGLLFAGLMLRRGP